MQSLIKKYIIKPFATGFPKVVFIFIVSTLFLSLIHNLFYLLNNYDNLKNWFLGINNCFYRYEFWTKDFFTQATKSAGNQFAIAGLIISAAGLVYALRNAKKYWNLRLYKDEGPGSDKTGIWYAVIILIAAALWYWGSTHIAGSYDEIFSAVNCAELPPFQTLAYYMLPNNHVFYNLLNSLFFSWHNDSVQTGRFISFIAYAGILCAAFSWFYKMIGNKWIAFLAVIPVSLQFSTWGFACQGRGYELQAFCGWMAFVSVSGYLQNNKSRLLRLNTIFCFIGFAIIPTFLYYYFCQFLFVSFFMLFRRRIDLKFIKHQLFCVLAVFLFYLPAICYSGIGSLNGNAFVVSMATGRAAYIPMLLSTFKYYINFIFSFLLGDQHPVNLILFFVPQLLFFSRRKQYRFTALFYTILWLSFSITAIYMKSHPPVRSLVLQLSLALAIIIYTFYALIELLIENVMKSERKMFFKAVSFVIIIAFCSLHLSRRDMDLEHISDLYGTPINYTYQIHSKAIDAIPAGSSIAFSDESFYYFYQCRKRHYNVSRCPKGDEDYFVIRPSENITSSITDRYLRVMEIEEDYELYKKK